MISSIMLMMWVMMMTSLMMMICAPSITEYFTALLMDMTNDHTPCCVAQGGGFRNRFRQNLGIAKKKGGGSKLCQDIFGGFDIVYRGQPKVMMDPPKRKLFPNK